MTDSHPFPHYQHPPVIEVVCGAQFEPMAGFTTAHLGKFWQRLPEEFNKTQEAEPLVPVIEGFNNAPLSIQVDASVFRSPRVWFINDGGDRVVQVQRDRFLCNWRKIAEQHEYPRYDWVSARFFEQLAGFEQFVLEAVGVAPVARQYELTYINHIPAGETWRSLGEISKILPDFGWRSQAGRFLPVPERVEFQTSFLLPARRGRLHLRVQSAERQLDGTPVLVVELTARGFGVDRIEWFNLGHEWIVKGFADLAGEGVQEAVWKKYK